MWLNGERVRLTGLTRHEESVQEGLAETRGTMKADWDDMKSLHVALTRPVHYPQHPFVLDYADRNGVLLAPEIPMWQFSEEQMKDPKVLALAKRMMQEMIEQASNHPSIFAWSVCNESATSTPGGRAYVKAMVEHVRALDPDRLVSYADDGLPGVTEAAQNANQYTDFIMMNEYFGSWTGPASGLSPALERVGTMFPDKTVIVSEFGLAGPFAPDTEQADRLRVGIMESQLAEFEKHDFIAGALFWCYQDYKSHRNLWPGLTSDWVEMGIVDENRQRLPSYFAWKERNRPARLGVVFSRGPSGPPTGLPRDGREARGGGDPVVRAAGLPPRVGGPGPRSGPARVGEDRPARDRLAGNGGGRLARDVVAGGDPLRARRFVRAAWWPRSETSAGGTPARAVSAPKRRRSGAWPRRSAYRGLSHPSPTTRSATSRAARSWPRAFQWSSSWRL